MREGKTLMQKINVFLLLKNTSSVIFPAYCEFSNSICRDLEPFLTLFQAERPLGVFLFRKLKDLVILLLGRIIRKEIMDDNKTCSKLLNLVKVLVEGSSNDYLLPLEAIEIGFSAKVVIRSLKSDNTKVFRERFQEKCSKICHQSDPKNLD